MFILVIMPPEVDEIPSDFAAYAKERGFRLMKIVWGTNESEIVSVVHALLVKYIFVFGGAGTLFLQIGQSKIPVISDFESLKECIG